MSVLTTVKLANRRHDLMICHSVHTKALLHCTVLFMRHEGRVCRAVSCLAAIEHSASAHCLRPLPYLLMFFQVVSNTCTQGVRNNTLAVPWCRWLPERREMCNWSRMTFVVMMHDEWGL